MSTIVATIRLVAAAAVLGGCALVPRLAPSALGCYAVQADSVPAVFDTLLAPPLPTLVRLDTVHGGLVQVPRAWREGQGYRMRWASLLLQRPEWRVVDDMVTAETRANGFFPPDSIALRFHAAGTYLTALLRADGEDWVGHGFVVSPLTPRGRPLMPMRLRRQACDSTPLAL